MNIPVGIKHVVVICVLQSKLGYLLLYRTEEPLIGKYIAVGGHLEPFETPRDATIREVKEETGITISDITFRGIMTETSPVDYNWVVYVYSAKIEPISPPPCPEGKLEWIPVNRLKEIPTPLTDQFMYDCLAKKEFFVFDAVYDKKAELVKLVDEFTGKILYQIP